MRLRGAIGGLLVFAVGLLGPPAAAADAPSAQRLLAHVDRLGWELGLPLEDPGSLNLRSIHSLSEVRLVNSDGYSIRVVAFGQTVALSVIRRSRSRQAATTYLAHGRVTPTAIVASFAERGRVELHFQRSTGPLGNAPFARCGSRGGRPILRDGLFVGGIRFRGEGGYTSAEAHRARGISIDIDALDACLRHRLRDRGRRETPHSRSLLGTLLALAASGDRQAPAPPGVPTHPSDRSPRTILFAQRKLPLSRTVFVALAGAKGQDARYAAAETASEGAIGVIRFVTAKAPSSSFAFDGTLSSARVAPPLPFDGKGLFDHGPGSEKSWTGSLSVSFLGAPQVPLTGTPFGTLLDQGF
jgi:hypothetical protein